MTAGPAVAAAPVAVDDAVTTVRNERVAVYVVENDTDADGDRLTIAAGTAGAHGAVLCRPDSGVCVYTPERAYEGPDSFTYRVSDGKGGTATATVRVTVAPALTGRAPVVRDDSAQTAEGTPVTVSTLTNDTDPDGDRLTLISNSAADYGVASCASDGRCGYRPDAGFAGPDSFTYQVSDGRGGVAEATVRITVRPTSGRNHAPAATVDQVTTVVDHEVAFDILANDVDADGDPLTPSLAGQENQRHGVVSCGGTGKGVCVYRPDPGFVGRDSFGYAVSDGRGGSTVSSVQIFVYSSRSDNRPPVAGNDAVSTDAGKSVRFVLSGNDSDPDGDPLLVFDPSVPDNGDVSCTAAGTCTYTPFTGFTGPDSFTYKVSDGQGGVASATVAVTVRPVATPNRAPVAAADRLTTTAGTAVSGNVLANDSDPDGDRLSVTSVTTPANGSARCSTAGQCTYTPRSGYSGTDTFRYTASDGRSGTATGTVTVTVARPATACQPVWWWPLSWLC